LVCDVEIDPASAREAIAAPKATRGLWKYAPLLPVLPEHAVSIGEGDTALLRLPRLGEAWGLSRLYAKVEGQNPTWSHKDRLCAVAAAAARWLGARVLTAASTGNHGASVAAYAARAGLGCVIFTLASVPSTMKTLMQAYGAEVVATRTIEGRYTLLTECVERFGWFPLTNSVQPPIGSNPYGVEGYKTLAYELWQQLGGEVPDWVAVPVGYGDCLAGIWRGFLDLVRLGLTERLPRLVAAEVFGPLARSLDAPDGPFGPVPTQPTHAFSIGTGYTTYQAVHAVRDAIGVAASASEKEMMETQLALGAHEGIYAEVASTLALASVRRLLASGTIDADDCVVALLTSSGLKDPAATAEGLPKVAVIDPSLEVLQSTLHEQWEARGAAAERNKLFFSPGRVGVG